MFVCSSCASVQVQRIYIYELKHVFVCSSSSSLQVQEHTFMSLNSNTRNLMNSNKTKNLMNCVSYGKDFQKRFGSNIDLQISKRFHENFHI